MGGHVVFSEIDADPASGSTQDEHVPPSGVTR
jgi:hypothetical protein